MAKPSKSNKQGKANKQQATAPGPRGTWLRLAWMALAAVWAYTVVALAGYSPSDPPSHFVVQPDAATVHNWAGPVGAWLAYHLYFIVGPGVWLILAGVLAALVAAAAGRRLADLPLRAAGAFVCAIAASGMVALYLPKAGPMPEGSGGLVAIWLVDLLTARFAVAGTAIVLLLMFAVGTIVAVDELVAAMPRAIGAVLARVAAIRLPRPVLVGLPSAVLARLRHRRRETHTLRPRPVPVRHSRTSTHAAEADADLDDEPDSESIDPEAGGMGATESFDPQETTAAARHRRSVESEAETDQVEPAEADDDSSESSGSNSQLDPEALREKIKRLPITFAKPSKPAGAPAPPPQDLSGYRFPTLDMLEEPEHSFNDEIARHVREQAEILERALQTYRIEAEVVAIDAGPVITLYEVQLAPGTKVAQLNNIASDVARELKAQNIRVVPNTAGKSTVGVEVPNLKKEKVRLKDLMTLGGEKTRDQMSLPMYLGKDASGDPLIADLAQMPHMLIAGTTGSGKSVCMNSIIMSFLFTRRPDELKLILVDPKMVEMAMFKDIPHLMCPVVTEMPKAAAILEWAVTKMDERYELLAEAGVRDIDSYNDLDWEDLKERFEPANETEEAKIPRKLPRLVFIIDELADLMMTHKEVENFIVRIAQKARAVGIHLLLATQRPQANVVTGLIKSNMPCRISFKVASGMDSRIVLDHKGAELLLGQGDMLYLSPRSSKLTRAQGTLVDDAEIRKAVRFLKDVAAPSFEPQLVQLKAPGGQTEDGSPVERDELFNDAVEIVLETQRGSVSLLQRRLAIGYSRASRLIEEMAEAGIIGAYKGSQAREVQISLEEWEAMKAQAQADAAAVEVNGNVQQELTFEPDAQAEADDDEYEPEEDGDEEEDDDEYEYDEEDEDDEEEYEDDADEYEDDDDGEEDEEEEED